MVTTHSAQFFVYSRTSSFSSSNELCHLPNSGMLPMSVSPNFLHASSHLHSPNPTLHHSVHPTHPTVGHLTWFTNSSFSRHTSMSHRMTLHSVHPADLPPCCQTQLRLRVYYTSFSRRALVLHHTNLHSVALLGPNDISTNPWPNRPFSPGSCDFPVPPQNYALHSSSLGWFVLWVDASPPQLSLLLIWSSAHRSSTQLTYPSITQLSASSYFNTLAHHLAAHSFVVAPVGPPIGRGTQDCPHMYIIFSIQTPLHDFCFGE